MKKIFLIGISLLFSLGSYWMFKGKTEEKEVQVRVETIEKGDISKSYYFQGVVVPEESIPMYIDVPTVVKKIMVKEGEEVEEGDPLIEFSDTIRGDLERDLEVIILDIKSRELQLNDLRSGSMKLELEERKVDRETLEEEINSLNRNISVTAFEAKNLKKRAEVMEELLKKGGVSSVQVDEAKAEAEKMNSTLEDMKTTLELTKQRYELSALSYERLKRDLILNESNIRGEYKKLILQKNNLEKKLSKLKAPLKAPITGVITELLVSEGTAVPQGGKLLSISPGNNYLINIEVPIHLSQWLDVGQTTLITTRGDEEKRKYSGSVKKVAKVAKLSDEEEYDERVIEVEVAIDNPEGMKPGYITEVEIIGSRKSDVILINAFSVLEEAGENYVYIVKDDIVNKVKVNIGERTSSKYEVLNLPVGIEVVVNPFKVKEGQKVSVVR